MIRRPPRSTLDRSSAASDVYKRQVFDSSFDLRQDVISVPNFKTKEKMDFVFNMQVYQLGCDTMPNVCLLYTSPSPRDRTRSRMPSSA